MDERAKAALEIIGYFADVDGAHHKQWTLDQAVRALCGCEMVTEEQPDLGYATNEEYEEWVRAWEEDDTYQWNTGVAP